MPSGRPTKYTKPLAAKICGRLAAGESMRSVSRDTKMPAMSTLFLWLRNHPIFSEQYEKAKEESADALAEDSLDIADNQVSQPLIGDDGKLIKIKGKVVMVKDAVSVQHARLRIDTRKWYASKLKPKKYGEKIHTEHSGSIDLSGKSDADLQEILDS